MKVSIKLINVPGSVANWEHARRAARRELPVLTPEQRSMAKDFGIPEEDYARDVLARRYSESRYRRYTERFARLLAKAARSYSVDSVEITYDGWDNRFHCWMEKNGGTIPIIFDADLVSVPLERGDKDLLLDTEKRIKRAVEWALQPVSAATPSLAARKGQ